jgi:2-polyprenyl-3-methyl-5-hydroxy-6-metoxy-1,4-benzoquinol methylase
VQHFGLPRRLVDRSDFILSYCRGRRVLHLGCADYANCGDFAVEPTTDGWLHRKIEAVAKEVVGIDNSREAVQLLRDKYRVRKVLFGDAEHLDELNLGVFDVIVAGEIIEHLQCPGMFLASAHAVVKAHGEMILTTVNAYCLRRFLRIPFHRESVHVDHVAYYSHRTLAHLAQLCGWEVIEQCSYRIRNTKPMLPYLVERLSCVISPNLCEGIVCRLRG